MYENWQLDMMACSTQDGYPSWPNNTQPTTNEGALREGGRKEEEGRRKIGGLKCPSQIDTKFFCQVITLSCLIRMASCPSTKARFCFGCLDDGACFKTYI